MALKHTLVFSFMALTTWIFFSNYEIYGPYEALEVQIRNHSVYINGMYYAGKITVCDANENCWNNIRCYSGGQSRKEVEQYLVEHYPLDSLRLVYRYRDYPGTIHMEPVSIYFLFDIFWILFEVSLLFSSFS